MTEFVADWLIVSDLGEGAFGEVKLLHHKTSGQSVALKIFRPPHPQGGGGDDDSEKKKESILMIKKEIQIHQKLQHEHVVGFLGARSDKDVWYIFLEYCCGGELYDRIEPDLGLIPHTQTKNFFSQIISGVEYLHKSGIVHRDLKPENILINNINGLDVLKISDFGLSTVFMKDGKERLLDNQCGTPPYTAPEILNLKTNYKAKPVDIWSCGIILVVMVGGELPWDCATPRNKEYQMWKSSTPISTPPWPKFDLPTLNFFKRLLCPLASKRLTIEQIKEHPWVVGKAYNKKRKFVGGDSPSINKRSKLASSSKATPSSSSHCCLSQPDPSFNQDSSSQNNNAFNLDTQILSFSQPPVFQEVQENSNCGGGDMPLERVLGGFRLSRFFITSQSKSASKLVTEKLDEFGYSWKLFTHGKKCVITITTTDKRKNKLVFKCTIIDLGSVNLNLLDFRLSRGDGLEFKKIFLRFKKEFEDILNNFSSFACVSALKC